MKVGEIVRADFGNYGAYISSIVKIAQDHQGKDRAIVKIMAVDRAPGKSAIASRFSLFDRQAYGKDSEQGIDIDLLQQYEGEIPDHKTSLIKSIEEALQDIGQRAEAIKRLADPKDKEKITEFINQAKAAYNADLIKTKGDSTICQVKKGQTFRFR